MCVSSSQLQNHKYKFLEILTITKNVFTTEIFQKLIWIDLLWNNYICVAFIVLEIKFFILSYFQIWTMENLPSRALLCERGFLRNSASKKVQHSVLYKCSKKNIIKKIKTRYLCVLKFTAALCVQCSCLSLTLILCWVVAANASPCLPQLVLKQPGLAERHTKSFLITDNQQGPAGLDTGLTWAFVLSD